MSAFHGFPALPGPEEIPLCKLNEVYCCGDLQYGSITTFTNAINKHPKINVTRDQYHHRTADDNISLYMDVQDNLFKKITSVWYNQGFIEALSVAADPTVNNESPALAVTASYLLKIANAFTALRYFVQPHLKDIGPKIVGNYSRTRNWSRAPVRCMAWHPHTTKIAVATSDDYVRVYCSEVQFISSLKCKDQGHVSSLSWRPYSASELAVGCEQGVIVWTVDPNSMFTKPSSSNAVVLKKAGHTPVTDVSWSPNADLLVSCSAADSTMLVWDVATESAVPLRRVAGGGVVSARWALDGSTLFASTTSIIFRLWNTQKWNQHRWCTRGNRVVASCWGPRMALFAAKGEPVVYSISDTGLMSGHITSRAQPVLDVSKVELPSGDPVGGPILDMCWDPSARYLAIMFEESHLIAVFCTTLLMVTQLKITPCCFVVGTETEMPSTMAFQQNFDEGACLTIAWSSGRVQHFPIIYTDGY